MLLPVLILKGWEYAYRSILVSLRSCCTNVLEMAVVQCRSPCAFGPADTGVFAVFCCSSLAAVSRGSMFFGRSKTLQQEVGQCQDKKTALAANRRSTAVSRATVLCDVSSSLGVYLPTVIMMWVAYLWSWLHNDHVCTVLLPSAVYGNRSLSSAASLVPFALTLELGALQQMAVTFSGHRMVKVR